MSTLIKAAIVDTVSTWMASRTPGLHRTLRPHWRTVRRFLPLETYWTRRKHLRYYQEAIRFARMYEPSGATVLDVGAASTEVLVALDWFHRRVALDVSDTFVRRGIDRVIMDFMDYVPPTRFDLVLCLQVIEHVEDPDAFARKLLDTGRTVILSVPYKWEAGRCVWHRHDPVDETKLERWTGRRPVETLVVSEEGDRLLAVYQDAS